MADPIGAELADLLADQEREALVELLHVVARDEEAVKPVNEAIRRNRDRLRGYHDLHPEDVLIDHERGYVASFNERREGAYIDLISLAENAPEPAHVLLALARAGILRANLTQLRPLAGKAAWADTALSFLDPGGATSVLKIERVVP